MKSRRKQRRPGRPRHADPGTGRRASAANGRPAAITDAPSRAAAPRPEREALAPPDAGHSDVTLRNARQQFEKWALSYDRSWLNELVFYPSIRACQEEIARWQQRRGGGRYRALDVGCGTGTLLALCAADPAAERLVGLDYSPEMTRRAAAKFAASAHAPRLHAVNGDSERLPFAEGSFDVITCCNSFHHYPHQAAVLRGFRRALRPGGLLVLIDGFRDNVIGWVIFDVAVTAIEKHVHHASWSEAREMILGAGFSALRQRKMNVLAPLLVSVAEA